MMQALVFIGRSGSGKTAVTRALAERTGLDLISSGDIARSMAETDRYAKAGLERGDWAPELAMREEVVARIEAASAKSGDFIIEGFPRRLEQLYIVESVPGIKPLYFYLECGALTCIRRLIERRREHDHPDAVATRFRAFNEYTTEMLDVIRPHLFTLNADYPVYVLVDQIMREYSPLRSE